MTQPNLLFVFSDQHRSCDLGCYGNPEVHTPHLDRFANGARRFTRAISNSPLCVPMRGSLLTGLFPWKHRALTNDLPVDPGAKSIAGVLSEGSYLTGYIGKWHLGGIPRDKAIPQGERLGFRHWQAYNCNHHYSKGFYFDGDNRRHEVGDHMAIAETDLAIDFIRRRASSPRPWSLHLAWEPPHDPYQDVPDRFRRQYDEAKLSLRPNVKIPAVKSMKESLGEERLRSDLAGYYSLISLLDEQFGRLVKTLESTGQLENTMVVYTSDHGDLHGSHGFVNKQMPQAESVRVPLLISGPGVAPGVSDELMGLTDLPVTLAGHLGLPWNAPAHGEDLSALLRDPAAKGPPGRLIFDLVPVHQSAARGAHEWLGVVTPGETWAMTSDQKDWVYWDDQQDPLQMNNLVGDEKAIPQAALLRHLTHALLGKHGYRFRPWKKMMVEDGFQSAWNKSQKHFGLPELIV